MADFALHGRDLFGDIIKPKAKSIVSERFEFPPFTVLDGRSGEWQERKRAWTAIGIRGEEGRAGLGDTCVTPMSYFANGKTIGGDSGSIFDPVLCELAYRWFSPSGGQVVDPFAGGSVRGVVAKALGRRYWGCDLRKEQVAANIAQAEEIFDGYEGHSGALPGVGWLDLQWVNGDSMEEVENAPECDFVFSCPPYGSLEKYSDDERDLSAMDHHAFVAAYKRIIMRCVRKMKPDSFACFVVGDFRDSKGFYRNFVSDTIDGFEQAGARLYNEAILVSPVGTAALRVTKQFNSGRKLCKLHQNMLVFVKGDWRAAAAKCMDDTSVVTASESE